MTLAECVRWWTKEWRGTFDVQLYLNHKRLIVIQTSVC